MHQPDRLLLVHASSPCLISLWSRIIGNVVHQSHQLSPIGPRLSVFRQLCLAVSPFIIRFVIGTVAVGVSSQCFSDEEKQLLQSISPQMFAFLQTVVFYILLYACIPLQTASDYREMKRTGGNRAPWRFWRSAVLLFLAGLGTSQYQKYDCDGPVSFSVVFAPQRRYASFSLLFADAGTIMKTFKRVINQGWRNGGRWMCSAFGCDYEQVKNQLYNQPQVFVAFKALWLQMDKLQSDIMQQGGGQATSTQKEHEYILLSKARHLLQQHLGLHYEIPARFLPPSTENNEEYRRPSTQNPVVRPGGQTSADTNASGGGAMHAVHREEDIRQRLNTSHDEVQLPTPQEFDRNARQRLSELHKQHTMQAMKLKTMSRQKLQMLTEAHEQETARLYNELQHTQAAELSAIREGLEKQRHVFMQALESFQVTGKLLSQSKTYMQKLYGGVQRMAAHFNRLITVEGKLSQLQKALQQDTPVNFLYSCLQAASQSDITIAQVMKLVLSIYEESTAVVEHVQKKLSEAETLIDNPAIDAARLTAHKQVLAARLSQFRAAVYNLIARMEETVQTAEERKLVALLTSEDVRNKVFQTMREKGAHWKERLTQLREQTDNVEFSHAQFTQLGEALGRRVLAAVNSVLGSSSDEPLTGISEEIAELEILGNKIREELSMIIEVLPVLEQDIRGLADNRGSANIPANVLEELGMPALIAALKREQELKERAQKLFISIRAGLARTENTLQILHALKKEAHLLRSPADREALDSEVRDLMEKLRKVNHSKAEVEVDLQHLKVDIKQLQDSIHQKSQWLTLERRSANLAGDIRGWIGKDEEKDEGDNKAAAAVAEIEEELKAATESLAVKHQQLAAKQKDKVHLLGEAKKLEEEVQSRQRIVAEEQMRVARMTELSQAVMENLQSDTTARRISQMSPPPAEQYPGRGPNGAASSR